MVSANEHSCKHGAQIKLWRSNSTFNLCVLYRGKKDVQNYESLKSLAGEPDVLPLHGGGAVHQEDQLGALGGAAEAWREGEEEEGGAVLSTALLHDELRASVVTRCCYIMMDSATTALQNGACTMHIPGAFPNKGAIKHPFHTTAT